MNFRLHIDIPFDKNITLDEAKELSEHIMSHVNIDKLELWNFTEEVTTVNFLLKSDDDRSNRNYLKQTESGHYINKKIKRQL